MKAVWTEIAQRICNRTSLIALGCAMLLAVMILILSFFCERHKEEDKTPTPDIDCFYIKSINPKPNFTQ